MAGYRGPAAVTEETFKGGVHATVGTLLAIMAAYNGMKCAGSHKTRNVLNVLLYVPLCLYEFKQAKYHWGRSE